MIIIIIENYFRFGINAVKIVKQTERIKEGEEAASMMHRKFQLTCLLLFLSIFFFILIFLLEKEKKKIENCFRVALQAN